MQTQIRLEALLREKPGLTPAEVARELRVDGSTAKYHLRRLAKTGRVHAEGRPRAHRYFAPGARSEERPRLVAARRGEPLLDAIRARPGASKSELARAMSLPRATLVWQLARLERVGLVRCIRAGRAVLVHPA